ncbi:hypothetical protein JHK85_001558 [Glycine max]|nr:hypothetical protein JHK85_001558 [Glycine max]
MATEPLPFSSASSIVPSSNNPQNDELHFLSDPKFERHGEILLLRVRSNLQQNEGSKLEA